MAVTTLDFSDDPSIIIGDPNAGGWFLPVFVIATVIYLLKRYT